jgi:hypothetical protein
MKSISSLSTPQEIKAMLRVAAVTVWGEVRANELSAQIKSASLHIYVLFQVPLSPRDGEPDYVDNALEDNVPRTAEPS